MLKIEKKKIDSLRKGGRVLVIGGGALGIQLASDVREAWKGKREVCLLHSRERLLNRFGERMHEESEYDDLSFLVVLALWETMVRAREKKQRKMLTVDSRVVSLFPAKSRFDALGIVYYLGERAIIPPEGFDLTSTTPKTVTTSKGNVIQCDVIVSRSRSSRRVFSF